MRSIRLTLKNYRCFEDSSPAVIDIENGLLALVGPNNSGKSSLLRFFYEFRQLFDVLKNPGTLAAYTFPESRLESAPNVPDKSEVFYNRNSRDLMIQVDVKDLAQTEIEQGRISCIKLALPRSSNTWQVRVFRGLDEVHFPHEARVQYPSGPSPDMQKANDDLMPLRETFQVFTDAQYFGSFRNAIAVDSQVPYYDIQVGKAFVRAWQLSKTGKDKANSLRVISLTHRIRDAFELNDLEINSSDDASTLSIVLNSKPYTLFELGGGLAQFIIVLMNAALKEPSLILIDEPEASLHPNLQLKFLTTLGLFAKDAVLFATHSYGLARSSATRIYLVKLDLGSGTSTVAQRESLPHLSEFLGEMSYSGRHDLGVDVVLLVEGPTDLTAIQQFLLKARKDHKVMMLPLGGASLINGNAEPHLQELKRIAPSVYALIDSEKSSAGDALSADREAFLSACQRAGVGAHALERRSLENYLSDRAIKSAKGEKYRALRHFEQLKDCDPRWSKSEAYKIAAEMTLEEIGGTDLGRFIDELP